MAALTQNRHRNGGNRFQSLFCWIGDGGIRDADAVELADTMFQSLFCWIGDGGPAQAGQGEC